MFRNEDGGWRAYRVSQVEVGASPSLDPIRIFAYYLGFNSTGALLVPQLEIISVTRYHSEQLIESLDVVPEWYIRNHANKLYSILTNRGKLYWECGSKPIYKSYNGSAWQVPLKGVRTPIGEGFGNRTDFIQSPLRVIVDYSTSSKHDRDIGLSQPGNLCCLACLGDSVHLGPYPKLPHDSDICIKEPTRGSNISRESEDIFLYCPSQVWAFSLHYETWELVQLEELEDVPCQDTAWEQLMLSEEKKAQLDSLVSSYFSDRDVKRGLADGERSTRPPLFGKRWGLNVLLHGKPGTGKSFTAGKTSTSCRLCPPWS